MVADYAAFHWTQMFQSCLKPGKLLIRRRLDGNRGSGPIMVKRISILSTYHENVGDDLIRLGVVYQLHKAFGRFLRFQYISKSNRLSTYFPKTWLSHAPVHRMPPVVRRLARAVGHRVEQSRWTHAIDKTIHHDLFVIAGTPLFYFVNRRSSFLQKETWPKIIDDRRSDSSTSLIALGVGSILDRPVAKILEQQPEERDFLKRFVRRASLVTVRDETTMRLLTSVDPESRHKIRRVMCPSVWACEAFGIQRISAAAASRRVLVSYSTESAGWDPNKHHTLDQRWQAARQVVEFFLKKEVQICLVSHNDLDYFAQAELAAQYGLKRPRRVSARSLLRLLSESRLMVSWRVHGAMAALSLGVPTLLFKTDTRFEMASESGAAIQDDRDLDPSKLNHVLESLYEGSSPSHINRLLDRRDKELGIIVGELRQTR